MSVSRRKVAKGCWYGSKQDVSPGRRSLPPFRGVVVYEQSDLILAISSVGVFSISQRVGSVYSSVFFCLNFYL